MNYAQFREYDIANGEGIRTTVFVSGCTLQCKNCFNQEYRDFHYGILWTDEFTQQILETLVSPVIEGLTILGGEPFQNTEGLILELGKIRNRISKSIWIYSGYTFEEILASPVKRKLLELCDVLVDGRYLDEMKDLTLRFRGSSNQRIIDISKSLMENKAVLYELQG